MCCWRLIDLDELKLTLYIFWRLERMEGPFHYLHFTDLLEDIPADQIHGKRSC